MDLDNIIASTAIILPIIFYAISMHTELKTLNKTLAKLQDNQTKLLKNLNEVYTDIEVLKTKFHLTNKDK